MTAGKQSLVSDLIDHLLCKLIGEGDFNKKDTFFSIGNGLNVIDSI